MENVVHKIYHITFPNNDTYVGSSHTPFYQRYASYRGLSKKSKSPICEVSTRYEFKEVKMVEVDRIECPMYNPKIKMLEEEWRKRLNPTLNIRKAYLSSEEDKKNRKQAHFLRNFIWKVFYLTYLTIKSSNTIVKLCVLRV